MAERPEIVIDDERLAGVWANQFTVSRSVHEFTLDFMRLDHRESRPLVGILVARVAVSALLLRRLADELERHWASYTRGSVPPDALDGNDAV